MNSKQEEQLFAFLFPNAHPFAEKGKQSQFYTYQTHTAFGKRADF